MGRRIWVLAADRLGLRPISEFSGPSICEPGSLPIEEPERPQDLLATFEWIGWDRIMFSTDYPHWDQDDPRYAIKVPIPEVERQRLFRGNVLALYGLD